jgi:[FeFe] hydrogenase H-cluster maturation GTPase HydF
MINTPRGLRPHLILAGKRNAGKSSFLNNLTGKEAAIVSDSPGTTTDPVYINMELLPFGPVTLVDTPGLDDTGELGDLRVKKGKGVLRAGDLTLWIIRPSEYDADFLHRLEKHDPALTVVLFSHADIQSELTQAQKIEAELSKNGFLCAHFSNANGGGIEEIKNLLVKKLRTVKKDERTLLEDMIKQFQLVMMIAPIDMEAPKGRLILPQVQAIREVLDSDSAALIVKDKEVDWALNLLKNDPDLAITDSQVVLKASASIPERIPLTTFSILFSRLKGDLDHFVASAKRIDSLEDGDRVIVAETCTHKTMCDDIGRVKIPRWLRQFTGKELNIEVSGGAFPQDLSDVKLIIHCGGCMITRNMMLTRVDDARVHEIPITNYGIAISHLHGVLDRVLAPFSFAGIEEKHRTKPKMLF